MKTRTLIFCFLLAFTFSAASMTRPPVKPSVASDESPSTTTTLQIPDDTRAFVNKPDGAGVKVDSTTNTLNGETRITIIFPTDMVNPDQIDSETAASPIVTWPNLDATFIWRTPSQGEWAVKGPFIPNQNYRLRLREDLKDAEGKPLPTNAWGMELHTDPINVICNYDEHEHLSAQPQVSLEFSYQVRPDASAKDIWFQNRATRQKYPAEILLNHASETATDVVDVHLPEMPALDGFRVRPRETLPVNATYDLIVENVRDAYSGRGLVYPRVFPLGTTRPLTIDYVAARNWPTDKPHIEAKFNTSLDNNLPANAVTVTPSVPNLRLHTEGADLMIEGDFDTAQHYRIILSDKIRDDRGYTMEKSSSWGATFHAKDATILFPERDIIRQRSLLGLRFALLQANTGPITWKLARIPLNKFSEISEDRRKAPPPALLIKKYALEIVGQGNIPASGQDKEIVRPIEWKPTDNTMLTGPYLLEASSTNADGDVIGNNIFTFFNEVVFTQKSTPTKTILRLANMGDAKPIPGVTVHAISRDEKELATAATDINGSVEFSTLALAGVAYYLADTPGTPAIASAQTNSAFSSGSTYQSPRPSILGKIITDRPLYRPSHEIKIKGIFREKTETGLKCLPAGTIVSWEIASTMENEILTSGTAKLNALGAWDAAWKVPPQGKLGGYQVRCKINDAYVGDPADFRIEEYSPPAFSVVCEPKTDTPSGEASIVVSSQYFHGAPNVGSKVVWKATWTSDHDGEMITISNPEEFREMDLLSQNVKAVVYESECEGETILDDKGSVTLTCKPPFKDPGNRAHCTVLWEANITGPDGQTITGGISQNITMNDITLGVKADHHSGKKDIAFDIQAIPFTPTTAVPEKVRAELFLVRTKSVKERIAPFIYRFRNTDEFISIEKKDIPANGHLVFSPKEPGRYILQVSPLSGQSGIPVTDEIYLSGTGEAEVAVQNDDTLEVKPLHDGDSFPSGQTAAFQVLSPSGGVAWVTVETDKILQTFTMELPGNSSRIEIPVRPEYLPNATVSVYLLRPGKKDELPGEMFGYTRMNVTDPAKDLKMQITVTKSEYEPREKIHGEVMVTADTKPVANAELTVYAVDDSVLELGGWVLPKLIDTFYPENPFGVVTYTALRGYVENIEQKSLMQKGFTVGDVGKDQFGSVKFTRQNFRPLILWLPAIKTDARGIASFDCTAPDNLTRFRIIVVGQTAENQFGSGDTTFNVTKNLLIEPALPRFLREDDQVELRAVVRQKFSPSEKLLVRCITSDGLAIVGTHETEVTAAKDQPVVVRFPAHAAGNSETASVRFDVVAKADSKRADSVEVTFPITTKSIVVQESATGEWHGNEFKLSTQIPETWKKSAGKYDLTLSTSQYLTKLMGIPTVLDYPHGCFEQKSSRLLVYTNLGKLLAYLPKSKTRDDNYQRTIHDSLKEFESSLLPDGLLPYWPFGTEGNPYVTIQITWAIAEAQKAGFEIPDELSSALTTTLQNFVLRKAKINLSPTQRTFALFALSRFEEAPGDEVTAAAEDLVLHRDKLDDEGRAMLAIALHDMDKLPERQIELVKELPQEIVQKEFNPETFSSQTRTEAICTWARILITPEVDQPAMKKKLEVLMASSASLSTQENLWLLVAFNAMLTQKPPTKLPQPLDPKSDAVSPDKSASEWTDRELNEIANFTVRNLGKASNGTFVASVHRQLTPAEQIPVSHGLRLSRVVKDLTDPKRTGTAEAPFKIGDQILISYRFSSDHSQSFVALTDSIPAGIEIVNPNLEMFGKFYQIPDEPGVKTAALSYCEMRDKQTNLYFNNMETGFQGYSVLARATAAGTFSWPVSQISPMYDSRFYARTAPLECVVTSE
ncbi:MAG: alpha-2-macroglobulin family protein [Chthoniobacterales bacterium]